MFTPFQLNYLAGSRRLAISFGYGMVTFATMMALNLLLLLVSRPDSEQRWTVLHELTWILLNIFFVAVGNLLYSRSIGVFPLTVNALFLSLAYTLAVGVFPTVASVLISEIRLRKRFESGSKNINRELELHPGAEPKESGSIRIPATLSKDNLQIAASDLLFIRAAENYIDIYYLQGKTVEKKLLRSSLTLVAAQLESANNVFFRCHKSYLINLAHVKRVSGNAQGYKLHLTHTDEAIPVSRQHNAILHHRLAVAPG